MVTARRVIHLCAMCAAAIGIILALDVVTHHEVPSDLPECTPHQVLEHVKHADGTDTYDCVRVALDGDR